MLITFWACFNYTQYKLCTFIRISCVQDYVCRIILSFNQSCTKYSHPHPPLCWGRQSRILFIHIAMTSNSLYLCVIVTVWTMTYWFELLFNWETIVSWLGETRGSEKRPRGGELLTGYTPLRLHKFHEAYVFKYNLS